MRFIKTLIQPVALGLMLIVYFWWSYVVPAAASVDDGGTVFEQIQSSINYHQIGSFTVACAAYMCVFMSVYILYSAYRIMTIFMQSPTTRQLIKMFSMYRIAFTMEI